MSHSRFPAIRVRILLILDESDVNWTNLLRIKNRQIHLLDRIDDFGTLKTIQMIPKSSIQARKLIGLYFKQSRCVTFTFSGNQNQNFLILDGSDVNWTNLLRIKNRQIHLLVRIDDLGTLKAFQMVPKSSIRASKWI